MRSERFTAAAPKGVIPGADYPYGHQISLSFRSEPFSIRAAVRMIRGAITPFGMTEDFVSSVEMVVVEALNNICEHAYGHRSGRVDLSFDRVADGLRFVLLDDGIPMPEDALPPGALPDILTSLPEGGFGWFLIRSQTVALSYQRVSGRNRLCFTVPLGISGRCS